MIPSLVSLTAGRFADDLCFMAPCSWPWGAANIAAKTRVLADVTACKAHLNAVLGGLGLGVGGLPYGPIHGEVDQRGLQMTCVLWQHVPGLGEL